LRYWIIFWISKITNNYI